MIIDQLVLTLRQLFCKVRSQHKYAGTVKCLVRLIQVSGLRNHIATACMLLVADVIEALPIQQLAYAII